MPTFRYWTPASLRALISEQTSGGGVRQRSANPGHETRHASSNGHPECPGRLCPCPNIETPERRWILEIHRPHPEHRLIWQIDFEPLFLFPSLAPSKLNKAPHLDTDFTVNADGAKERIHCDRSEQEARAKTHNRLRPPCDNRTTGRVFERFSRALFRRRTGPLIRTN